MQAVILAAGMGTRIREIHALPKGFIHVGEQTLIDRSIQCLRDFGILDILIVTGFKAVCYVPLKEKYNRLQTIFNSHYHCYSSLYSLYCAKDFISDDFLLLESDIIYESRAIENLLNDVRANVILLSGTTQSSDEVYVEVLAQKLMAMSKQKNNLREENILGEFVGINKISYDAYRSLIKTLKNEPSLLQKGHYEEQGLVKMAQLTDVYCLKIDDLWWGEIDNEFQLKRMQNLHERVTE